MVLLSVFQKERNLHITRSNLDKSLRNVGEIKEKLGPGKMAQCL